MGISSIFVAFFASQAEKGIGFCWVSLFSLPFSLLAGEKGIGFRGFLCFSLPFSLLAGGKGIGFCWVSLFSLPFSLLAGGKGIGFCRVFLFSLPFGNHTYSGNFLTHLSFFSHAIDGLMHFLKKPVVAQVSIRHFAKPRPETQ